MCLIISTRQLSPGTSMCLGSIHHLQLTVTDLWIKGGVDWCPAPIKLSSMVTNSRLGFSEVEQAKLHNLPNCSS